MLFHVLVAAAALVGQPNEANTLLDRLASRNATPPEPDERPGRKRPPPGYNSRFQDDVYAAIDRLVNLAADGTDAEIALRATDSRYSVTEDDFGNGLNNRSVGGVCFDILRHRIEVYGPRIQRDCEPELIMKYWPQAYVSEIVANPKNRQAWIERHRKSSLYDIQLEAMEWTLKRERMLKDKYGIGKPESVQELLDELKATKMPIPVLKYKVRERW
jgi:hypothetical protein